MRRLSICNAHRLLGAAFLFTGLAVAQHSAHAQSLDSSGIRAVPTYEAVGLYWSAPAADSNGCEVKFRQSGGSTWTQGLNLWFDSASNECRGSLVNLVPGTAYEVQLNLPGRAATKGINFSTWSNTVPVAQTIAVNSGAGTFNVAQGGSANGYVVYDGNGATLDAANGAPYNVTINASYVVLRGLTLKGAQQHGILISKDVHDVIIEDNDISGWGRTRDGTWGADMDSGIRAICVNQELTRVTIQRNKIHDPRYSANSWAVAHPAGPQGITFSYCGGNNVYRWNEIDGGAKHFNDGMGGEDNFSTSGWPNKDSDVYGNKVQNAWDDGIEVEGGDQNVRVWGNYVNNSGTGISSTIDSVGPLYMFRNVWNRNTFIEGASCDSDQKQPMFKDGSSSDFGNGRRYLFHNTMLQAQATGCQYGLGGGAGIGGTGSAQLVHNTVSMNNIYHVWKPNGAFYQIGADNTFQNDMTNAVSTPEVGGIVATPVYAAGNGWQSEDGGLYALAAGTPGFDQGVRIPNFNDDFAGAAPDVGAAEAGKGAMKFGIAAATSSSSSGGSGSGVPTPPSNPVDPVTGGTGTVAATIDSSAYTINAGESVTFTAALQGASGTPSGSVTFRDNGSSIGACIGVALAGGRATCTTSALAGGSHAITSLYSGDAVYAAALAGPITQTVNGSIAPPPPPPSSGNGSTSASATMDSSSYTIAAGQAVTFTARIMGNAGTPSGTVRFQDNGSAIAGCTAIALSGGVATCATSALAAGSHPITGIYSGDATYSAAQAGPITQTVNAPAGGSTNAATVNVQGLWWQPSESGWGVNLAQQGDLVFATWFTYDAQGNGQWLVMPSGTATGSNSWSGALYRTTGPAYSSATFDASQVTRTAVGTASFSFTDANNGTFSATVDGRSITKAITRQVFANPTATCAVGAKAGATPNYQDLWWRSGGTESGWGLNITHQGDVLFMTWFTYDADGSGLWLVAPSVARTGAGTYTGTLYRTWGPAFDSAAFDPAQVSRMPVGTVSFSFGDAATGTLTYTVNGVTQSKPISREVFATPATMCQ